jgi:hypothetical protein
MIGAGFLEVSAAVVFLRHERREVEPGATSDQAQRDNIGYSNARRRRHGGVLIRYAINGASTTAQKRSAIQKWSG